MRFLKAAKTIAACAISLTITLRELAANIAPHATLSDEDVSVDFAEHTKVTDRVAVVVSAPLTTNEHWTAFAPGELKVFETGMSGSA